MKLCPTIIPKGKRLAHLTERAFALTEDPRIVGPRQYRDYTALTSAEWCGFTNYPWERGLINFKPHEAELALERSIQASALDATRVDFSDDEVNGTMDRIADGVENSGGLYAADK
jgi:hypothetical protein